MSRMFPEDRDEAHSECGKTKPSPPKKLKLRIAMEGAPDNFLKVLAMIFYLSFVLTFIASCLMA